MTIQLNRVVDPLTMSHMSALEINSKWRGSKEKDEEKDEENERTP